MRNKLSFCILTSTIVLNGVGCSFFAKNEKQISPAPDVIAKGREIYQMTCKSCHGEKADGNGPDGMYLSTTPTNLVIGKFKNGDKTDDIYNLLSKGVKDIDMSVYDKRLTDEERKSVSYYIHSLRKKEPQ